jgi:hypothetical protein
MNYEKIYYSIVNKRKKCPPEGYVEKHHIIPRSLGGSDDKSNIVALTSKEHFVCHLLLTKMHPIGSKEWESMMRAIMYMQVYSESHNGNRYVGRLHQIYRERASAIMSEFQRGEKNTQYGTMWIFSIEKRKSKKIPKDVDIPEGWVKGRVMDFEHISSIEDLKIRKYEAAVKRKERRTGKKAPSMQDLEDRQRKIIEAHYDAFIKGGYTSIREYSRSEKCDRSHASIARMFNKYIYKK